MAAKAITNIIGGRFAAGMLIALLALTACSSKTTVKPEGAAKSVVDVVSGQTGFHPTDVSCPSGVEAKVGQEFDCHFTGPEGKPYSAHMRITKVEGQEVDFDVKSRPSQS
jgi:Domain of unknown function (DUF4333)